MLCNLCGSEMLPFYQDRKREYWRCDCCQLVQVPEAQRVNREQEKAIYQLHENDSSDQGYRQFLKRAFDPVVETVGSGAKGLDFGCGPGPTLSKMFEESGYHCRNYDLYFYSDDSVFKDTYQFVTLTEVIEHLGEPREVLWKLWGMLEAGGILVIMTKRWLSLDAFSGWHYKNDLTHISFFSEATFHWVAEWLGAELDIVGSDVVVFKKANVFSQG